MLSQAQGNTIDFLTNTLNRLRDNLAANFDHYKPLAGILMTIYLLRDEIEGMNANTAVINEMLDLIYIWAHRLENLTYKMLKEMKSMIIINLSIVLCNQHRIVLRMICYTTCDMKLHATFCIGELKTILVTSEA